MSSDHINCGAMIYCTLSVVMVETERLARASVSAAPERRRTREPVRRRHRRGARRSEWARRPYWWARAARAGRRDADRRWTGRTRRPAQSTNTISNSSTYEYLPLYSITLWSATESWAPNKLRDAQVTFLNGGQSSSSARSPLGAPNSPSNRADVLRRWMKRSEYPPTSQKQTLPSSWLPFRIRGSKQIM